MPELEIADLEWTDWNIAHIARHDVTKEEVDEVCSGSPVAWDTYAGRLMVVGPTQAGRMLSVILALVNEGVYFPVTARVADRKEKRRYIELKGGETAA